MKEIHNSVALSVGGDTRPRAVTNSSTEHSDGGAVYVAGGAPGRLRAEAWKPGSSDFKGNWGLSTSF